MKKNDYENPQMSIFVWWENDVITSSGDTDVGFEDELTEMAGNLWKGESL